MQYLNLPITNFVVVSEDEDVEDVGSADFDKADAMLNKLRDEQPEKAWTLIAEIDA